MNPKPCVLKTHSEITQEKIRSSFCIATYEQCLDELIQNSLDAKATQVSVTCNIEDFNIDIFDNGLGFSKHNLGLVGTRHFTSKCCDLYTFENSIKTYGFRGEALASICILANSVTISSCAKNDKVVFSKKISDFGKTHSLVMKDHTASFDRRGTSIKVKKLFQKELLRKNNVSPAAEIDSIKKTIQKLALINYDVSFYLTESSYNLKVSYQKRNTISERFEQIFGSVYPNHYLSHNSQTFKSGFIIETYVGKKAHSFENLQFLYLNKRYITKGKIHKTLQEFLFKRFIVESQSRNDIRHGPHHMVFLVLITCSPSLFDISNKISKTSPTFHNLDNVISEIILTIENKSQFSLESTILSNPISDNEINERLKVAEDKILMIGSEAHHSKDEQKKYLKRMKENKKIKEEKEESFINESAKQESIDNSNPCKSSLNKREEGCLKRAPLANLNYHKYYFNHQRISSIEVPFKIKNESFKLNSASRKRFCSSFSSSPLLQQIQPFRLKHKKIRTCDEDKFSQINKDNLVTDHIVVFTGCKKEQRITQLKRLFPNQLQSLKLNRSALHNNLVIGQVDNKFISTVIKSPLDEDNSLLLLFDQHAVDERVRMETFLEESCEKNEKGILKLNKSKLLEELELDIGSDCVDTFRSHQTYLRELEQECDIFNKHGLSFKIISNNKIKMLCAPTVLVKRSNQSKSADSLTKSILQLLKEVSMMIANKNYSASPITNSIHNLLASRACHGAIRFGDQLTVEKCQDLMMKLSLCKLPFQCAHGRPSVIPLLELSKPSPQPSKINWKKFYENIQ